MEQGFDSVPLKLVSWTHCLLRDHVGRSSSHKSQGFCEDAELGGVPHLDGIVCPESLHTDFVSYLNIDRRAGAEQCP